jgi:hypothetical protein
MTVEAGPTGERNVAAKVNEVSQLAPAFEKVKGRSFRNAESDLQDD